MACLPLDHYAPYQRRKHPQPTTAVSTADVPNVRSPISTAKLSLYSRDANNGFRLYKLHAYNVNGLTPFHECSSFHSFVLYPILVANCYICALIVNECTNTVQYVTFINRASPVDPPPLSGYSRLGPVACIINVVMVTL